MSEPLIRRRSLPDSLRYLAQKLDGPLPDAERAGVALTLNSLADEIDPDAAEVVNPRDELWDTLGIDPDRISREEFDEYLDAYDEAASAGPARPDEEPTT